MFLRRRVSLQGKGEEWWCYRDHTAGSSPCPVMNMASCAIFYMRLFLFPDPFLGGNHSTPRSKMLPSISAIFLTFPLFHTEDKQDFLKKKFSTFYCIKINMCLRKVLYPTEESNFLFVNASNQYEKKYRNRSFINNLNQKFSINNSNSKLLKTGKHYQTTFLIAIQWCLEKKAISRSANLAVVTRWQ